MNRLTSDLTGHCNIYPYEHSSKEDMLICSPFPSTTTGEEIFYELNIFSKKTIGIEIIALTLTLLDGANAVTGKTDEIVIRIKRKACDRPSSHCILHRQALKIKKISAKPEIGSG